MQTHKKRAREVYQERNLRRRKPRSGTVWTSNRLYFSVIRNFIRDISNDTQNSIISPGDMDTTAYFYKWMKLLWQTIGQERIIKRPRIWDNGTEHAMIMRRYLGSHDRFWEDSRQILQYQLSYDPRASWQKQVIPLYQERGREYHERSSRPDETIHKHE